MEGQRVGKYHLVAKIGSGAMGEVYRAHDPVLNRDVAVKTMAEIYAADDQLVQRFRREAQSAARLNHPNIVTVFDFGEEQGRFYLAMELLEGTDLKELIVARALSDLWDQLDVMEQIAEGLAYAHLQGVVHRDLKPANIRVLPNGRVKVMDFGLARIGTSEMTRAGTVMGTPNYMSPEQVKGTQADARSDIFSLGALFYELLSGKKAFQADSMHTILFQVLEEKPEPVSRWVPSLPAPFVALIEKCLEKDPARRFAHAGELRDALRKVREALASGQYTPGGEAEATLPDVMPIVDQNAPTMMAPGTVLAAHGAARAATKGAAALDLTRMPAASSHPLPGAPTLSGRARTEMRSEAGQVEVAPSRWPVYVGAAAVMAALAGGGVLLLRSRLSPTPTPGAADVTTEQVGALKEALVGNQVELARADLENKDYKAAVARAQRALALDPTSAEAREVLVRAERTAAELETVAIEARRAFDAGDTDRATRALARVLSLDPRHPVAGELTAALNVHFRKQAEDARRMAEDSRRGAEPGRAGGAEGYAQADRAAREASGLLERGEFAVATQKFLESRDGFERARRVAEAAARAAAAAAAAAATRPVPVVPPTLVARNVPPPIAIPPVTGPAATLPQAIPPAPPLSATGEVAIRRLIADYGRAIESKDVALFKAVKPNLTPDEEKRLQESFKAIKSQQVGITIDAVQVDGAQATVKVTRQDTINGKAVKPIQQVFRLGQAGGGWVIQAIGLQ